MKIIVSHDIDHYKWTDHIFKDLFIPKSIIRNNIFLLKGQLSFKDYFKRYALFMENRQHRLNELIRFNQSHNIPDTYFLGMRNALNLSYSLSNAEKIIKIIREQSPGSLIGVHGIAYNDKLQMQEEYDRFLKIAGKMDGMRMHYLRNDHTTLGILNEIGYEFDSTTYELKDPYKVGNMMEFPAAIMDVYVKGVKRSNNQKKIQEYSMKVINEALEKKLSYFTLISHDVYFDTAFASYRDWYVWIIEWFKSQGFEFVNFRTALRELQAR